MKIKNTIYQQQSIRSETTPDGLYFLVETTVAPCQVVSIMLDRAGSRCYLLSIPAAQVPTLIECLQSVQIWGNGCSAAEIAESKEKV